MIICLKELGEELIHFLEEIKSFCEGMIKNGWRYTANTVYCLIYVML